MIKGLEFHNIIGSIFDGDVKGLYESEQLRVCCPRCQQRANLGLPDGKYNLEINTAKKIFNCWKCDEPKFSGTIKRLVKYYGSKSDLELYNSYTLLDGLNNFENDDLNDTVNKLVELPKEYISFRDINIHNKDHFDAYTYMILDRKFDYELLLKFNIGFCIEGDFQGRIIIPSYDVYGNINYFTARTFKNHKTKFKNPDVKKDDIIFNEGLINWDSTIYLVEGVFEMLTIPINTMILLGKKLSKGIFLMLKDKKPNIIILLDPDAYKKSIEIFQILFSIYGDESHKIKLVVLNGELDLDEIRKRDGIDSIKKIMYGLRGLTLDDIFAT